MLFSFFSVLFLWGIPMSITDYTRKIISLKENYLRRKRQTVLIKRNLSYFGLYHTPPFDDPCLNAVCILFKSISFSLCHIVKWGKKDINLNKLVCVLISNIFLFYHLKTAKCFNMCSGNDWLS